MLKAVVHAEKAGIQGLCYRDMEEREPGNGEVKVKLKVAGLNHRDLFVLHRHKPTDPPLIIGSDGAGIVEAIGQGVTNVQVGDEVIINPGLNWEKESPAPPENFDIVGLPGHGTFAEQIIIPAQNAVAKPSYLSWEEAGVFPLAALTAYRALFTRGQIQANQTLLLPGIGSGVATFILQFAKAVGGKVFVTSRSTEKAQEAIKLGADKAIDSNKDWDAQLDGEKVDIVIESVGAATFDKSLHQLKHGGTIVVFGASAGDDIQLNLRNFFYGQYNLLGSTMGSAEELTELIQFMEEYKIRPIIDKIYPLSDYKLAFERIETATQFGKIGFTIE